MPDATHELAEIRRIAAEAWRAWQRAPGSCACCGEAQSDLADALDDALFRRILGPDFDYEGSA